MDSDELRQRRFAEMGSRKRIALVAHDNKKDDLVRWVRHNRETLVRHDLYATGTTGRVLQEHLDLPVTRLQSGPLGGDQQLGAMIVDGEIDCLIFFWDPLESQPHDPDVKALLRISAVWNIPIATNLATADFLITSPLFSAAYQHALADYEDYHRRILPASAEISDKE